MRERLVVSPDSLLTNDFWDCFRRDFRFSWPFTLQEAYQVDHATGRFQFSSLFENRHHDISMWQMEERFFTSFPEFIDDMKAVGSDHGEHTAGADYPSGTPYGGELGPSYRFIHTNDRYNAPEDQALWLI
jgi:hypothetical protein